MISVNPGLLRIACSALVLLIAAPPSVAPPVRAQERDPVERAVSGFLAAFDDLDMSRFIECFTDDATVFHPPSAPPRTFPTRLQGRSEIQRTFQVVFDQIRTLSKRTSAPYQRIQPQNLLIQRYDGLAIVTFHLGTDMVRGRRTVVMRQVGAEWKIVHLHASTFDVDRK